MTGRAWSLTLCTAGLAVAVFLANGPPSPEPRGRKLLVSGLWAGGESRHCRRSTLGRRCTTTTNWRSMSEHERQRLARRLAHYTAALPRDTPVSTPPPPPVLEPDGALLPRPDPVDRPLGHQIATATTWPGTGRRLGRFRRGTAAWLLLTAWAAWRRRQIVILAALVTATLLVTDAWFDVLTARTHRRPSHQRGLGDLHRAPPRRHLVLGDAAALARDHAQCPTHGGQRGTRPAVLEGATVLRGPEPDAGGEDAGSERSGQETLRSEPGG